MSASTSDALLGALLMLGCCAALAAALVPRWRVALVAAAAASLGAAAALFAQRTTPDSRCEPQRPFRNSDHVHAIPDPASPTRDALDVEREEIERLPDDDLRDRLDDYDRRANGQRPGDL